MVMRSSASAFCSLALLAACQTPVPLTATPSFTTFPALAARNPSDIAVLPVEDGSEAKDASRLLEFMRQVLRERLPDRHYAPLATAVVDAALHDVHPGAGETLLTPAFLKRVAGRATEDAMLAVRVDRWDESRLLSEKHVAFQLQAALVGNDGEQMWSGTLSGDVKAGGMGAAPRDRDAMARSCAEIALGELLNHLALRQP